MTLWALWPSFREPRSSLRPVGWGFRDKPATLGGGGAGREAAWQLGTYLILACLSPFGGRRVDCCFCPVSLFSLIFKGFYLWLCLSASGFVPFLAAGLLSMYSWFWVSFCYLKLKNDIIYQGSEFRITIYFSISS